jgi:hypothetical protein
MIRSFLAGLLVMFQGSLVVACAASHFSETIIEGFSHPESVFVHDGVVYVANVGAELQPMALDGDGFISAVRPDGTIIEQKFLPAQGVLNAPKGMAVIGSTLYVADVNRIVGFDLTTRKTVFELVMPETSFLNDLTVRDDHTLFASATDIGKIAEVDLAKRRYTFLALPPLKGPNGLWFERSGNVLYYVEFGADNQPDGDVMAVSFNPLQTRRIGSVQGYLDGVQMYGDVLYVSDWKSFEKKGVVHAISSATGRSAEVAFPELIGGPADFYISPDGYIVVPAMLENRVYIKKL